MRRSAPDSGVLIRLKAQMAEVRSKMSDIKCQVMEARGSGGPGGEPRPGPSGVEQGPASLHVDPELAALAFHKSSQLDLMRKGSAARSKHCRTGN